MDRNLLWIILGLAGQACFFSRFLVQWIASERARRSVVPRVFWHLSLMGSACLVAYALYRGDPVFVLSVLPATFIYARNLFIKKSASATQLIPIALALLVFSIWATASKPQVDSMGWAVIGFCGYAIWTSRFIAQWWVSERQGEAVMPVSFWIMSLVGNIFLLAYSIHLKDPVFIPGQSIGYIVYSRNLYLIYRERKEKGL